MSAPTTLFCAAILMAGCATDPSRHVGRSGSDCPMNFTQYCTVTGHRAEDRRETCRCIRQRDISDMLSGEY